MMLNFRPKTLLGAALFAFIGVSVACSDSNPDGASAGGTGSTTGTSCGTPQLGCACATPGAQVACGKKVTGDQSFVYCFEGVRTCLSTGVYGDCESGTVIEHATSTQNVHITALGATAACNTTTTGTIKVCTAGRHQGEPCDAIEDCTAGVKMCTGSNDSTAHCRDDGDCHIDCAQFSGNCTSGPTPNVGCNVDGDCGAGGACTYAGGTGTCNVFTGVCDSANPLDGRECNADTDCGAGGQCITLTAKGTCLGGWRNTRKCHLNRQCIGGGTCTADVGDGGLGTSGSLDPCDPFCQVYSDTAPGVDAGPGFLVTDAGLTPNAGCGNATVNPGEQCDDGNTVSGDGCNSSCRLEVGWYCPTPGAACVHSTCGNGTVEGLEQCDDHNLRPYDGCSPTCTLEANCPQTEPGGCLAVCGDGIKFDSEDCDDGNLTNGDGCDSSCHVEPGASCVTQTAPTPSSIDVPVIYRDFNPNTHPDFQKTVSGYLPHALPLSANARAAGNPNCGSNLQQGMPSFGLGADKEPFRRQSPETPITAATTNCTLSVGSFYQWWHDDSSANITILGRSLRLFRLGDGSYVFNSASDTVTDPRINCGNGASTSSCVMQNADLSGGFFPINGLGYGNWTATKNYAFTSEVRYPFTFRGGEVLNFTGDDDVFVYVNSKLIVDLGGVHPAISKSVTLSTTTALDPASGGSVALVSGHTYEIAVFQTERNTVGSNYKLTLGGFNQTQSICSFPPSPTVVVRDFQATCASGEQAVWQLFRWKAAVTASQSIDFRAATSDTEGGLPANPSAPSTVAVGSATSANNPTVWADSGDPVSKDLASAAPPQLSKQWLRVYMKFNGSPSLSEWQQMYDCVPVE